MSETKTDSRHSPMALRYLTNETKWMMTQLDMKLCREFAGEYLGCGLDWPDFLGHPASIAYLVFEFSASENMPRCVSLPYLMPCTKVKTIRDDDGNLFEVDADPISTAAKLETRLDPIDLAIQATRLLYLRRQEATQRHDLSLASTPARRKIKMAHNLQDRNDNLEAMLKQIWYMARRYADGRCTVAPSIVNEVYDKCQKIGIDLGDDNGEKYASDGNFGTWMPDKQTFEQTGTTTK